MVELKLSILALSATLVQIVTAQFVPAPTDLIETEGHAGVKVRYKEVPTGICELDPNVKSYSGYVDVGKDQHTFFWFFEARNQNTSEAPLTVWINGGPGSSSMIGLFQELGPCFIDMDGNPYNNIYSWSNASNMIFIDQPTQVGFSYSKPLPGYKDPLTGAQVTLPDDNCPGYAGDSCGTYSYYDQTLTANSTFAAAPNFWRTLQGFMGAFPQYSREEFYFTTESYGGHYGPIFNEYILEQNAKNVEGAKKINLAAVLIGNGWYDPLIQYAAYYNYTVSPGNTYDYSPYNNTIQDYVYNSMYGPGNCYDMIEQCYETGRNDVCAYADNFCYAQVENVLDVITNRDEYDIRELSPDPYPPEFFVDYLNTEKVQKAIGAYVNYSESSSAVSAAFTTTGDDGRVLTTVQDMLKLVEANITVIMYTGDADYNCNWLGGEAISNAISAPNFSTAGYTNITTSSTQVHGQVKQAANFAFVRVYDAGHEVPFYQPLLALEMFERAIAGMDIATGTVPATSTYVSDGEARSTYRNGNSTVQYTVLPRNSTYNTTNHVPNPPSLGGKGRQARRRSRNRLRRGGR